MIVREKDYVKLREKTYKLESNEIECPKCKGYGDMSVQNDDENITVLLCTKCSGAGKIEWIERIKRDPEKLLGTYI